MVAGSRMALMSKPKITWAWMTHAGRETIHAAEFLLHNPDVQVFTHYGQADWRNSDRHIREWWRENRENVTGEIIVTAEWDVKADVDVSRFLRPVAGVEFKRIIKDSWCWFIESDHLPNHLRRHACGVAPLGFAVWNRRALDKLCSEEHDDVFAQDIFCELRLPTVLRSSGIPVDLLNPEINVECAADELSVDRLACPGIHHPVKMKKRPNRLVATCIIGKLTGAEFCVEALREYASKSGADYHEMKWMHNIHDEYHGHPNWCVVDFLRHFAAQDFYTEVLVVDCDVLIRKTCPNLFDLPGDLVCAPDQCWPTKDERYRAWLSRNFPNSPEVKKDGDLYFNAGVLLFRLDALRRMDLRGPYPDDYALDQDFLNMRAGEAGLDITWLDERFNQRWLPSPGEVGNNQILHFIGQKHRMEEFYKELF